MIYNSLLFLSLLYIVPKWLIQKKYRGSLLQRLGLKQPKPSNKKPVIWIHMCSVGETKAMVTLYKQLYAKYPKGAFYLSSTTKTGHEEAKRSLPKAADYFFLPLDFSWVTTALVKHLQTTLFILSEGEFWPNAIAAVKSRGGQVILLNGKLSEKSAKRFATFPKIASKCFEPIDHFFVQSQEYATRFQSLNIPQSKISVTGNLKLAAPLAPLTPEQKITWQQKFDIQTDDLVIALGSTHHGEEEALLPLMPPHAKVLIAPRHPERFPSVKKLLNNPRFILVDQMGILSICYQLSHFAIVGGSFIPGIGGHNIFEPIQAKIPVIFGPYMQNQQELAALILRAQAGLQTSIKNIPQAIEQIYTLQPNAAKLAEAAFQRGEESLKQILPYITCS